MEAINELNEAVKMVVESVYKIGQQVSGEVFKNAPILIHQRFCARLVEVCKEHPNKRPSEVPQAEDVLTALRVLEELYPELKKP